MTLKTVLKFKILVLLLFVGLAPQSMGITTNDPVFNEIRIERQKRVPMRDGTVLYADIYLPAKPGKYPTIITRTPYGLQRDGVHERMIKFAQRGYAVVVQDVRGRYESEGIWEPFVDEANDGFDTIEWAAAQDFPMAK